MVFFGVGCVIINLFWVSFLSSDFKAIIQFTCWFLLTHPGQRRRRHSGDSSYWRRPRDGGRQNKEHTQEVHEACCTYGTTHLFNTQRIFVIFLRFLFDISLVVVAVWLWNSGSGCCYGLLWVCSHWKVHLLVVLVFWLVVVVVVVKIPQSECGGSFVSAAASHLSKRISPHTPRQATTATGKVATADPTASTCLETVHLELVRLRQARLGQPLANVFPLVALQLQNLTVLGMLNHSAIARKFLLTCSHDLLQVVLRRQALHGG